MSCSKPSEPVLITMLQELCRILPANHKICNLVNCYSFLFVVTVSQYSLAVVLLIVNLYLLFMCLMYFIELDLLNVEVTTSNLVLNKNHQVTIKLVTNLKNHKSFLLDLSFADRISDLIQRKYRSLKLRFSQQFWNSCSFEPAFLWASFIPMTSFISCNSILKYPHLFDFYEFRFLQAPLRSD